MYEQYCEIFCRCYPAFGMSAERFESLLINDGSHIITHYEDGVPAGFIITEGAAIRLICVEPKFQHCGIGSKLISEAEAYAVENGIGELLTGGVSSKFLIGADKASWGFFEKNGFESVGGCDEMLIRLKDYTFNEDSFRGHRMAEFGWYEGDAETLREAVAAVDENWVQYFDENSRVYCATVDGKIASFCLVTLDAQNYLTDSHGRVGMPGCVGTVPEMRNNGIGIEMIARVTEYLKNEGMDISFIFFTGVADWYKKLGYEIFMTEIFGKKEL